MVYTWAYAKQLDPLRSLKIGPCCPTSASFFTNTLSVQTVPFWAGPFFPNIFNDCTTLSIFKLMGATFQKPRGIQGFRHLVTPQFEIDKVIRHIAESLGLSLEAWRRYDQQGLTINPKWKNGLRKEDLRVLTPLFYVHITSMGCSG